MISVTILVKNGQKHIEKVLQAVTRFEEVVLLDTGSSDKTLEIAKCFTNVTIHNAPFIGFGPSHNILSSLAKHDWILSVDADEVLTDELVQEIQALLLDDSCLYYIRRNNFYRGKWIKGCGWYPDIVARLYNRKKTHFTDAQVHESILATNLKKVVLKHGLNHYPYDTVEDFLAKMQSYSSLFAKQNAKKKRSSLLHALAHGFFAFFKSYILKRGIVLGHEGFVISLYNGHTAYYKYLKLQEANKSKVI